MRRMLQAGTLMLLLFLLASCGRGGTPSAAGSCDPVVGQVRYGESQDAEVAKRLKELFEADQAGRTSGGPIDWEKMKAEDAKRRAEVAQYLAEGKVVSGQSQFHAAMLFQHGNCPDHYLLANQLAEKAMEQGYYSARWLYAATLDRYLISQGKPQKYGTQYQMIGERKELFPVDPATTDEERVRYNVPPLSKAKGN